MSKNKKGLIVGSIVALGIIAVGSISLIILNKNSEIAVAESNVITENTGNLEEIKKDILLADEKVDNGDYESGLNGYSKAFEDLLKVGIDIIEQENSENSIITEIEQLCEEVANKVENVEKLISESKEEAIEESTGNNDTNSSNTNNGDNSNNNSNTNSNVNNNAQSNTSNNSTSSNNTSDNNSSVNNETNPTNTSNNTNNTPNNPNESNNSSSTNKDYASMSDEEFWNSLGIEFSDEDISNQIYDDTEQYGGSWNVQVGY